jgi:hypothetical protein
VWLSTSGHEPRSLFSELRGSAIKSTETREIGSRTCKPNSVCRIAPAGRSFLWATHCCEAQATYPEVVTHRAGTRPGRTRSSLPIWSCSVWGLPCPPHYCDSGALLPHLFTLTLALPPGRYVFCGTFRRTGFNPASRTLSGTQLCGVRTFLPRRPKASRATVRSGCQQNHYIRCKNFEARTLDLGLQTSDLGRWPSAAGTFEGQRSEV